MKNHKILTVFIGMGAFIDGKNMVMWNINPKALKFLYEKKFLNVKPSTYTKKQEGMVWCALACLQGLLRYKNPEKYIQRCFWKYMVHTDF